MALRQTLASTVMIAMALTATGIEAQSPPSAAPSAGVPAPGFFGWALNPVPAVPAAPAPRAPQALDPMSQAMAAMMGPAIAAMNPYFYGQWSGFLVNPAIDATTKHDVLEAMMAAFDPAVLVGYQQAASGQYPRLRIPGFPTQSAQPVPPNTVTRGVSSEAKRKFYQAMMMMSPLSMRDMMSIMADKMLVAEDVTFDDAIEAMKLRANEVNFKLVSHNPIWLDVRAISGDEDTPRVEIFQFCDAMVGRQVLDYAPEFVVFLPCRIALIEDAERRIWVMTLDWDMGWLDYVQNPNSLVDADLRKHARRIHDAMRYIMEGAASGDF